MANKNISGDVNVEFTEAQSRQSLESGESVKTLFGKLRKWLTDLKPVAFSGSYNDLSNKPTIPSNATIIGAVNGTGALSGIAVNRKCGLAQHSASGTSATPWYKVADVTLAAYKDYTITFYVDSGLEGSANNVGILRVYTRIGASLQSPEHLKIRWLLAGANVDLNRFALSYNKSTGVCAIYANCAGAYTSYRFTVMSESDALNKQDTSVWTVYNATTGIASLPTGDNIVTAYSELATTQTGSQSVKSTNIDRTINPSSYKVGESQLVYRDTNNKAIGALFPFRSANGDEWVSFYAYNETTSGTQVNNAFEMGVARDGTAKYQLSSPSAFRDSIDAAYDAQCDYNTDNGVKNLLEITTETQTINGVTFTVDKVAGTVTANGTASSTIWSFILVQNKIYPYDVIISGCPQGGNWSNTYSIQTDSVDGTTYYDFGDGFTFPQGKSLLLRIVIRSGYTANNLVFKPMIRSANITDSTFVPYAEPNYILTRNSKLYETSDTTPYIYKSSEHDAVYDELVGGSVAWNQLVQNGNFESTSRWAGRYSTISVSNNVCTVTPSSDGTFRGLIGVDTITDTTIAGHKYLISVDVLSPVVTNIALSMEGVEAQFAYAPANAWRRCACIWMNTSSTRRRIYALLADNVTTSQTIMYKNVYTIDLTQMFDPTIADYVYNLEQSTAGSGIAWLKSYGFFTKDYYPYNAGALTSVNVSGKKIVGKNLLKITAESTTINGVTFTVDKAAGTITANGTASATSFFAWKFTVENGSYILSGCPTGGSINYYRIDIRNNVGGTTTPDNAIDVGTGTTALNLTEDTDYYLNIRIQSGYTANNLVFKPMIRRADVTDSTFEPYTSITYPIHPTDLRGVYKLDANNKLYTDGDIYSADGQITRKYGYRDYQSGDESLANAITDGTHTIYKLSAPTIETASSYTSPQMVYRNGTEEYLDSRDMPMPVGGNRKYVDIPEWMVNKYFDDVRSSASGAIAGDLVFDESSSAHGHGLVSSDNKKEIVFNHHMITLTSSSGNRVSLSDGDEQGQIILRQGDVEISGYKHSSQGDSQSASVHVYYEAIEVNTGNDGIIITNVMQSGTGVNLVIAPDGTICKASSSRNVKHDIEYVEDTKSYHDALMQLKPATFIYNSDETETQKLGMIAEDVADVCPIAGMTDKDGKVENYDDRAIIAMLVAEVQRLNKLINKKEENQNE